MQTLESLAYLAYGQGDIQLASSLILVGPSSFNVSVDQQTRIVEAYLELLDRHRLAVISADLRSKLDPFKQTTLVSHGRHVLDGISTDKVTP